MYATHVDVLHNVFVATPASRFRNFQVKLCDLNVVRILPGREIKRMKKPIACLDRILANQIVGRVTIVAGRSGAVTRLHPRFMLGTHGMAIGAGRGVVEHIRVPLCINKAVPGHTKEDPDHERQQQDVAIFH